MPINLPDELSKLVHAAADHPHPNILTAQKEHIYKLMKMDPYGRLVSQTQSLSLSRRLRPITRSRFVRLVVEKKSETVFFLKIFARRPILQALAARIGRAIHVDRG